MDLLMDQEQFKFKVAKLMSDRFANISSNLKEGKDSMKHAIEEYHRENRQRAEMIREQNSINPNGATFLKFNRLMRDIKCFVMTN